ncbi:galactose-1-phosphate uridylyltransferase [Geobacter pelophilus]|uniref:Galactose-1-phosphate uridylyltransferase n=1 Tax=Geoanaerobacter pelophilus TaxID=60036 RepID=A0AAW4L9K2_9BACT|nr:galactose-1-phosphate uridylyltransferase [Geoanaerobacter pelophilus]MBT0665230.1 galactose-1-phosphate uridylyltransferase [Geoanaerobacter pelophilus]
MSELRWDPLKKHWVIIATERGRRPLDFHQDTPATTMISCPFCYGHEARTPQEIFAIRPPGPANTPNWKVRVIPNKYPVLRVEGEVKSRGYGLYDVMDGIGAHEIIIETPDHDRGLADLSIAELTDVLKAYRARYLDLRQDFRLRYMVLFKNHGTLAGATLQHSHSQLIAVPLIPPVATTELNACREFFATKERCIFCDMIDFEISCGERVVKEFPDYVTLTPYASASPFELRLFPKKHCHDFALLNDGQLGALAQAMKDMLCRLKVVLKDPPYNFILHTAPPAHQRLGKPDYWGSLAWDYHWHIELVPRLTQIAGFEWGTGFYINPTAPEDAAAFLREAEV